MTAPTSSPPRRPGLATADAQAAHAQVAAARRQVDSGVWVVIALGLAFTAVNVQAFAAGDAAPWSAAWAVAWLLDPMVSVLLLCIVRAEQVTARWQVSMGWQVTTGKWGCFAATYVMNTWASWRTGVPSGVVLHSVPPIAVLLAAEAAPIVRDRLTAAASAAAAADQGSPATLWDHRTVPAPGDVGAAAAPLTSGPPETSLPEIPSVPAATGTPSREGAEREGPDAAISPAGDGTGPRLGPAPDTPASDAPATAAPAAPMATPAVSGRGDAVAPAGPAHIENASSTTVVTGEDRVRLLLALLDAGNPVTGQHAAVLLSHLGEPTSDRTGRRLLAEARQAQPDRAHTDRAHTDRAHTGRARRHDTEFPERAAHDARTGTDHVGPSDLVDRGPGLVLLPSSDRADGGRR